MSILEDCQPFAEKHRGRYTTSGPYWSTIIRFVQLYDYACELEAALREIEVHEGSWRDVDWARRRASEALAVGDSNQGANHGN